MRDDLIDASEHEDAHIPINSSPEFCSKTERYERAMNIINQATVALQERFLTLSNGRDVLDTLIESVHEERSNPSSDLYRCKLGVHYISQSADIIKDKHFENGVIKIQKNCLNLLTDEEKSAVEHLRKSNTIESTDSASQSLSFMERLAKKRRKLSSSVEYVNCDFIHCSVAEVERLWSLCGRVLQDDRRSMTPQLLESLVFLRLNERFWDPVLVSESIRNTRSERAASRLRDHELHQNIINHYLN